MGFFSDLKEDWSQVVNELMPEEKLEEEKLEEIKMEEVKVEEVKPKAITIPEVDTQTKESVEEKTKAEKPAVFVEEKTEAEKPAVVVEEKTETEKPAVFVEEKKDIETAENILRTRNKWSKEVKQEETVHNVISQVQENKKMEQYKGANKTMDNTSKMMAEETSVITAGMTITGDVVSEGSVEVIGKIKGNIDVLGKLNITGHITGNSKAAEIIAEGAKINGEVTSEGPVKIGASSVIIGNISATSATIAGAVKGDIDVKGPIVLETSAIVMGNIKSKSVQISNGAVIEGMCSQCYADVNPTAFFNDYTMDGKDK